MEILLIAILIACAWFWLDSISKREMAINLGHELAQRCQLQLLDDTVACTKLSLGRDTRGHAQIIRRYTFEVSANSTERLSCHLELLGSKLSHWHIPPHQQPHLHIVH